MKSMASATKKSASLPKLSNVNISEETFASWSQGPGQTEADKCANAESAVRRAIANDDELKKRDITVFPQGSYRARTNVRQDSDVDICIRYNSTFFDIYPEGKTREEFGNVAGSMNFAAFKDMVGTALTNYFGHENVKRGNKAFDVHANTYRIAADVIPTFEHRRYTGQLNSNGSYYYLSGVAFDPDNGGRVFNWPQQNYDNGVAKNNQTGRSFKRAVRIIKRLRYAMEDDGVAAAKDIPSFLIECLVWNVPNDYFLHSSYTADVRAALAHLFNNTLKYEDCSEWGEENELKYLFRGPQPWTREQAHNFVSAAWDYAGFE
jgi:hypothetical protein